MKIAYLTTGDSTDPLAQSGTAHFIRRALQRHVGDVVDVSLPFKEMAIGRFGARIAGLSRKLTGRTWNWRQQLWAARYLSRLTERRIGNGHDLIFSALASAEVSHLRTPVPVVFWSDTTFGLLLDYYWPRDSLWPINIAAGHRIVEKVLSRSAAVIYPTDWAARSAVEDYGAAAAKVHVVPSGPALDDGDIPDAGRARDRHMTAPCRLLFVGVDWQRKRGALAFDTLIELERLGIQAELTVCGCVPPAEVRHPRLTVIPFLDKKDPAQRKRLLDLYLEHHFFLLPTQSETFGYVFVEASAFGLPSMTTRTGGVPTVVRDGENGFCLPLDATGAAYARRIAALCADDAAYRQLVDSTRGAYDDRLNWSVWGRKVRELVAAL